MAILLRFRVGLVCAALGAVFCALAGAQQNATCLVLAFENRSGNASLDWLGESFPPALAEPLDAAGLEVMTRAQRLQLLQQTAIPAAATLSHATAMRLADRSDAGWLVTGWYDYDGTVLSVHAALLNVAREHLVTLAPQSGPLEDIEVVQQRLAAGLRAAIFPGAPPPVTRSTFVRLPLAAYENYVRALVSTSPAVQLKLLLTANQLAPRDPRIFFALGERYMTTTQDASALAWLARVPASSPDFVQAQFLAGVAAYHLSQFARAAALFQGLAGDYPLPEVLNNWAVSQGREAQLARRRAALPILRRALVLEPDDKTMRANLVKLEALATGHAPRDTVPALLTDFPAAAFRVLAAAVAQFDAAKTATLPPAERVRYEVQAGRDLAAQGAADEAERNFRAALAGAAPLDPMQAAAAHAGLAALLWARNDAPGAARENAAALRLDPANADALALQPKLTGGHS